ncbi:TniB family NTP-binding protein [Nocardia sp. CWNU-33]|uniref:TniB family NTP-binding protein n=1 Tax=Nocardia sp. CWNU-33 TaxID=3392117 RepID=UPI00398E8461
MHPVLAEPRTKEEWRQYLSAKAPKEPDMPTYAEYKEMSDFARARFNRARTACHSAGAIVRTPTVQTLHHELQRRLDVNRHQPAGARRGKVIDGPATLGKSTLVKMFASEYENRLRAVEPERCVTDEGQEFVRDYVPIVYVSIGASATPKDLSIAIAEFLMVPYRISATKTDITNLVLKAMRICGTELIILDDAHSLDISAKEGKVANDHLKYLANHTAATFVYTGVDLEASGLFLEGKAKARATQTAGRNDLCKIAPFAISTQDHIQEWRTVIARMESSLLLFAHNQGASCATTGATCTTEPEAASPASRTLSAKAPSKPSTTALKPLPENSWTAS